MTAQHKFALLTALLPLSLAAQTTMGYNLHKYAPTGESLTDQWGAYPPDIEQGGTHMAMATGALVHRLHALGDSSLHRFRQTERNVVRADFCNDNAAGAVVFHQGKRNTRGQLQASGELTMGGRGTLFGAATYSKGQSRGQSLNYAISPQSYAPYFVSDTLGQRTIDTETYRILGGYSRAIGRWSLGLDAVYEGIAHAGKHAPRLSNYAHFVRLGLSGAGSWGRHIVALRLMPEWSRETITANSVMEGVRYFTFYGFGLWNRRESQGSHGYGRMQTIRGIGATATWLHTGSCPGGLELGGRLRSMNTEENNLKELFSSATQDICQRLWLNCKVGRNNLFLQLSSSALLRRGKEHVYENKVQNEEQGLYDYVRVGTNNLYTYRRAHVALCAKIAFPLSPRSTFSLQDAVQWLRSEETYKSPAVSVINQTLSCALKAAYRHACRRSEIEVAVCEDLQGGWGNIFSVVGALTSTQIHMSLTPWQIAGENRRTTACSLSWGHHIDRRKTIGLLCSLAYANGDHRRVFATKAGLFLLF